MWCRPRQRRDVDRFRSYCTLRLERVAMNWTDERVELLKKLWAEGLSASQIAAQLGSVTRNAVIGKVAPPEAVEPRPFDRRTRQAEEAGIDGRQERRAAPPRSARHVTTSIGATALAAAVRRRAGGRATITCGRSRMSSCRSRAGCKLVQLSERTCKWPNGDPLTEDFSFCGANSDRALLHVSLPDGLPAGPPNGAGAAEAAFRAPPDRSVGSCRQHSGARAPQRGTTS